MRTLLCMLALLVAACADTDPWRRAEAAPTPPLSPIEAARVYDERWPPHFMCTQAVTLDFGPVTRALSGYLIVSPGRFRLQGMTEQGLTLFDIAGTESDLLILQATADFDARILANIARDIRRVFLARLPAAPEVAPQGDGTRVTARAPGRTLTAQFVSDPPRVDWVRENGPRRERYRADFYEWADFHGRTLPSVVVVRERGIESDGPAYKLTIEITRLEARTTPWPARAFGESE